MASAQELQDKYEIRPHPQALTQNHEDPSQNAKTGVDYEPHPEKSLPISPEQEGMVKAITSLYSRKASKKDMEVYAEESIHDDPWSYCSNRRDIAGQWYGIPKVFASSKILKTEVVEAFLTHIVWKQQQEYTPRLLHVGKKVNSLVTLTLDEQGKIKYHKDVWKEKDYSH